jgi:prophage antirepressor-like protein
MNEMQIFSNPAFGQVRTAGTPENPLFCLADVCNAVELTNPSSVKSRLDREDVQLIDLHALNYQMVGNSMATFVNEAGFYDVLLFSTSPKVKPFRRWVTHEVLPSIRKTGQYSVAQPSLNDKLQANLTFADWTIKTLNLNEASKICWAKKIAEKFDIPTEALPSGVNAGTEAPTLHAAKDLLKENNIPFTSVAFNRILMAKGVIHEATRPSRDKNKPWKWKVLNKGFECFGQNIQDPNFQSQTQIKWYDNRFRDLLEFVGIEIPQTLGF